VDTKNPERGPMLIISGEKGHTVPRAIADALYDKQKRNTAVTEFMEMPNRGHALTIDNGWREVADTALAFVKRFGQGRALDIPPIDESFDVPLTATSIGPPATTVPAAAGPRS